MQDQSQRTGARTARTLRRVLVVDDDESLRHMLVVLLKREGYEATAVASAEGALRELESGSFELVLSDIDLPHLGSLHLVDEIQRRGWKISVILMAALGSLDVAIQAMRRGGYDYVSKPIRPDEVLLVVNRAEEREQLSRENTSLKQSLEQRQLDEQRGFGQTVAASPRMQALLRTIRKISEYKTTVLITGESGTGKELVARAVHQHSPRAAGPFVAVNCGAIPESLLESELFGHKRGAFTDAIRDKRGLFEEASGGTLFLDEIGEMPLTPQVKLLRVLQEQVVRPIGEVQDLKVDVRVVAATVRDLHREVEEGRFREDLFYRLNVVHLQLPPLRERKEDIAPLIESFIRRANARLGTHIESLSTDAMKLLIDYAWPGNVRELENTIERAVVLSEGRLIEASGLPDKIRMLQDPVRQTLHSGELSIKKTVRIIEEELIRRALRQTRGNRTSASKLLEISHRALLYKIKEYGIRDL